MISDRRHPKQEFGIQGAARLCRREPELSSLTTRYSSVFLLACSFSLWSQLYPSCMSALLSRGGRWIVHIIRWSVYRRLI